MEMSEILKDKKVWGLIIGSFAGGAAFGYFLGKRDGDVFVVPAEVLDPEQELVTLDDIHVGVIVDAALIEIVEEAFEVEPEPELFPDIRGEDESVAAAVINVFYNENANWDHDVELSQRSKDTPYIISAAEYIADDMGFRQDTLTYYKGDDILADVTDSPIYNHAEMVGELRFGHGSNDPNVVYVRNEKTQMEWEILLHNGRFEVEVMGYQAEAQMENELRHSAPQKFRSRD